MSNALAPRATPTDPPATDGSIRINLTLPVLRFGIGPLVIDPVEQFIGMKVSDIFSSLMTGPVFRRPSASGPAVEVYPLALPEGEGASVPLGQFGELGFKAERGLLVLTVPLGFSGWVQKRFGDAIVRGPVEGLSLDGTARVVRFAIIVKAGMKASIPLGMMGEFGVEGG
jgi:hypothetical protein